MLARGVGWVGMRERFEVGDESESGIFSGGWRVECESALLCVCVCVFE